MENESDKATAIFEYAFENVLKTSSDSAIIIIS